MKFSIILKTMVMSLLTAAVLAMSPVAVHAKKVALLVGIQDYQNMRDQSDTTSNLPIGDLRGCVNDVHDLRQVIMDRYGFKTENIRVLINQEATKANILDAMNNWLVQQVEKDDVVLMFITGHGTQVLSRGADPKEIWDQALVCYDYAPVSSAQDAPVAKRNIIVDNDFGKLFDKLGEKTGNITFIADSCYSGSLSRDPLPGLYSGKWLPAVKSDVKMAKDALDSSAIMNAVNEKVTFIGACADIEQASEAEMPDGKWHGAMSYSLLNILEQGSENLSYGEMISTMKAQVQSKFRQTPQLKTQHPEWPVLGGPTGPASTAAAPVVIPVIAPPAAVTTTTTTTVQQPAVNTITTSTIVTAPRNDILYVKLVSHDASVQQALALHLDAIANVDIAQTNGYADRIIAVTSRGGKFRADLTMRDGVVDAVVEGANAEEMAVALRPFLQKAWLIKIVSSVRSADSSMEPQIEINAGLPKNLSIKPISVANPGLPVVYTGGTATFSVKPSKPCYLTLIDIGTDGSMSVLLPNKIHPSSVKLMPGQTYQVPTSDMGFDIVVEPPTGTEMVVAIATEQPLEWNNLAINIDESRGGIGTIQNVLDGSRLFMVKPKSDIAVTTQTTTTITASNGLLPSEGFGIAFTMAEVCKTK